MVGGPELPATRGVVTSMTVSLHEHEMAVQPAGDHRTGQGAIVRVASMTTRSDFVRRVRLEWFHDERPPPLRYRSSAVDTCMPRAPLRRRDHIEVLSPDVVELPSTVIHNSAADLAFRDKPASKTAGIEITHRHLLAGDHCRKLVETI